MIASVGVQAQTEPDGAGAAARPGYVRLAQPEAGAALYADGVRLGPATGAAYAVAAGAVRLALVEEGEETWNARRTEAEVDVPAGDTLDVALALPVRYRVTTVPPGVVVTLETAGGLRETLGTAPLVLDRPAAVQGQFVATHPGHLDARVAAGDSATNRVRLVLRPLTPEEGRAADWRPPRRARAWIDYAAAGVAIASAVVAVHYKFQADAVDDRYRTPGSPERGNPELRAEAERLDGYALGGLIGMQVGLGILAIRLVLR